MTTVAFRPYQPTPTEARRLRAHGWRRDGEHWFPPWPSLLSYTYRAAVLEQARVPQHKSKSLLPLEIKP